MSSALILNSAFRITPRDPGRVGVGLLGSDTRLEASAYQARLLAHFAAPQSIEAVLAEYPFETESSREFLARARDLGVLVVCDPAGQAAVPDLSPVARRFMSAPAFDPAAPPPFVVIGAPADLGTSGLPGARFGPAAVREASEAAPLGLDPATLRPGGVYDHAAEAWRLVGVEFADAGDVTVGPGEPLAEVVGPRLTRALQQIWGAGSLPLLIGGDHALTFFALDACPEPEFGVVHLDAHTDLGDRGAALHHGNVFTHVVERLEQVTHVWQAGLRGLSDADGVEERVTGVGMHRLRREGVAGLLRDIPEDLPLYLSVDIDVTDPAFAPATGTPVPGGLFPHELSEIVSTLTRARRVVGVDVMEVAAPLGAHDGTAAIAMQVLLTAADGIVQHLSGSLDEAAEDT